MCVLNAAFSHCTTASSMSCDLYTTIQAVLVFSTEHLTFAQQQSSGLENPFPNMPLAVPLDGHEMKGLASPQMQAALWCILVNSVASRSSACCQLAPESVLGSCSCTRSNKALPIAVFDDQAKT